MGLENFESPNVILYDINGNLLSVQSGVATPEGTQALMIAGSDGTNSRYILIDSSGRQVIVGNGTDNTTNSTAKLPALVGLANTSAPTWTNGNMVPLSVDTSGALRITGSISASNPSVSTTSATPPGSATYIGGSVTTAAPTYTTGQLNALSLTTAGALRTDGSATTQPISGTVSIAGLPFTVIGNVAAGSVTSGAPILMGGSDGTNIRYLSTDNGGRSIIKIGDGANNVAIKGASTSPTTSDSALVVAISPNSDKVATATLSNIVSSIISVTLLSLNTNRKAGVIVNDSTKALFIKYGSIASSSSYTYKLIAGATLELPSPIYTGIITGAWAGANGNARVTELSP